MAPELPSFLRRRLRLHEARKALLVGSPEEALCILEDPALALSEEADRLRERVLDLLCREALREGLAGESAASLRHLGLVARHDPRRAESCRRRLAQECGPEVREPAARRRSSALIGALEQVLAEMRAERERGRESEPAEPRPKSRVAPAPPEGSGERFLLALDDLGEYLVATGSSLVIGHARRPEVDLPFLADLDSRHACLRRGESFHGGPSFHLEPLSGRELEVDGRPVPPGGSPLADGDLVRLAPRLRLRFRAPDATSGSAVLELLDGAECAGATRVLLLAPGPSGRMRFGSRALRGGRPLESSLEVRLELAPEGLRLESESGIWQRGAAASAPELRVPCPPPVRIDFQVGRSQGSRPPFGFSIRPLEASS